MGTSKFTFPIPGRRSKPTPPPPVTTAPRTKAEKLLGTGEVVDDHSKLSPDPKWGWDARSNSGISIAISDTTASHSGHVETGLGIVQEGEVTGSPARRGHWEDESAIIPPGMVGHDGVTDASSLRRRQSSSTITSYYDKSKLPLSISQQTSNSAMAKGLPTKASMLLDIEGVYAEPASKTKKKKPAMLDLTGLLNRQRSSKFLRPETYKGLVLGPDLITKSPSIVSSPDATPPPIAQRVERHIRKKITKESLREAPTPEPLRQSPAAARPTPRSRGEDRGHRPTKSTVDLMNLYDHYEQRSFADVLEEHEHTESSDSVSELPTYPTPPTSSHNGYLAPQQSSGVRMAMPAKHAALMGSAHDVALMGTSPSSLVSPPTADTASISSRHTRTSKASKRTDRSLTDLDLQQNSVLSLSSDSEDDGYEASSKSSLAIPALSMSDGQASPTSPRSAISQRSAATAPQEGNRGKLPKRTSFATHPQFLPIPEGAPAANLPPRSSSLSPNATSKGQGQLLHQTSRLSIGTTSTGRTVSGGTIHGPKTNGGSPPRQPAWSAGVDGYDDFPAPPAQNGPRFLAALQSREEPTPPLSPTSVDFYLQSHRGSKVAFDIDTRSISSGRSMGSLSKGVRRGSAASSHHESNSGRFMAVTRQEEMLLAALRQKRALMRGDSTAGLDEHHDGEGDGLQRQYTNGSSSGISRQSSMSTMRTVDATSFGGLGARPHQPQIRVSASNSELRREKVVREQILLMMDRPSDERTGLETAEPSPDLDGFLGFDDSFDFPMPERGRAASAESASGPSPKSRKTTPSPAAPLRSVSSAKESLRRQDTDQSSLQSGRRGSDKGNPDPIMEDPREDDEDLGVPRPDSPISPMDFPVPMSMTRKKQVRLSAVGNYKPNIEAGWWNDSG